MKHFLTASAMLCSFLAAAQFPNLPYNPDENGDGLIGVVDLQGLLANYGSEFSSAVLSDDGESAIVYIGLEQYPVCAFICKSLPGFWEIPTLEEFGMIWDEVGSETSQNNNSSRFYVRPSNPDGNNTSYDVEVFSRYQYGYGLSGFSMHSDDIEHHCYCAAKQLPRVEYSYCSGGAPNEAAFNQCINEKLAEGWYTLSGFPSMRDQQGYIGDNDGWNNAYSPQTHASFWRWAE